MLGQVPPTPYDLRFSLFGIPVRVHPFFWIMAAIFAWPSGGLELVRSPASLLVTGMVCLFVSILVHEMGHALTARYFGWPPEVVLYHMGGYAMFYPSWGHTTRRAVLVLLAGPGAGFLLYFAVWGITALLERQGVDLDFNARVAVRYLEWINLWWGFANLLPVYPLDGGQIARHVLAARWPRNGLQLSLQISMLVAGSVAAYFFAERQQFAALLFAVLCYESFQAYQRFSHRGGYYR